MTVNLPPELMTPRLRRIIAEKERRRRANQISWPENIEWREVGLDLLPHNADTGELLSWAPQEGSQRSFLDCGVDEALYEGTRGPGKTAALLMSYAKYVGRGFGDAWLGILFRRTYAELGDVIVKSKRLFSKLFPDARYNESKHEWRWPGGEQLIFRYADSVADYDHYHGHEYPWIGWEELTRWASPDLYKKMISLCRSTKPGMPRHIRATTNPYGPGHNWVKTRFGLPLNDGEVMGNILVEIDEESGKPLPPRIAFHGTLAENLVMLHADPNYEAKIRAAASNAEEAKAWLEGSWDIVAGGIIDDIWKRSIHVLPRIPIDLIPKKWQIARAYDHGTSKPFSVGWWLKSNGEPIVLPNGRIVGPVRGDVIRFRELYGWNGKPNEGAKMSSRDIARRIRALEEEWGIASRVRGGIADSAIFSGSEDDPKKSVASEMESEGIEWEPADKRPGSRKNGATIVRDLLKGAIPDEEGYREDPGMFITEDNPQWLRTVPILPRSNKDPDDVDTEAEDHAWDETRYFAVQPDFPLTGAARFKALSR